MAAPRTVEAGVEDMAVVVEVGVVTEEEVAADMEAAVVTVLRRPSPVTRWATWVRLSVSSTGAR